MVQPISLTEHQKNHNIKCLNVSRPLSNNWIIQTGDNTELPKVKSSTTTQSAKKLHWLCPTRPNSSDLRKRKSAKDWKRKMEEFYHNKKNYHSLSRTRNILWSCLSREEYKPIQNGIHASKCVKMIKDGICLKLAIRNGTLMSFWATWRSKWTKLRNKKLNKIRSYSWKCSRITKLLHLTLKCIEWLPNLQLIHAGNYFKDQSDRMPFNNFWTI